MKCCKCSNETITEEEADKLRNSNFANYCREHANEIIEEADKDNGKGWIRA